MKKEFKVGDRVAVYQGTALDHCFKKGREVGKVIALEFGMVRVQLDGYQWNAYSYHPNQLRRLVKKKRREFWICTQVEQKDFMTDGRCTHITDKPVSGWIHVREVKRK